MNLIYVFFNRPDLTSLSFETVRASRPERLFLVADGPRPGVPTDAERCREARAVVENVDWPCEVVRDFSDTNLGCSRRVSSGITNAFRQVDRAIVLEDDCIPDPSFFRYCTTLLERYEHDERIMAISGNNFQRGIRRGRGDYYFSKYAHCWGWATWRRSWNHFDLGLRSWPAAREEHVLAAHCPVESERKYWSDIFTRIHAGQIDSWAYPWQLCVWLQSGLTILPNVNLVSNIGFRSDATHTTDENSVAAAIPAIPLDRLTPPDFVVPDTAADWFSARMQFGIDVRSPASRYLSIPRKLLSAARRRLLKKS